MIFKMQNRVTRNHSDFSIEHILTRAGPGCTGDDSTGTAANEGCRRGSESFQWLSCTRFCPPRVPRVQKRESPQKRQLGKYPRIPFTNDQIALLEEKFQRSPYLSSEQARGLSKQLQLAEVKVKIWFQNRRARKRREEMGDVKKDERNKAVEKKSFRSDASCSGLVLSRPIADVPMPVLCVTRQHEVFRR